MSNVNAHNAEPISVPIHNSLVPQRLHNTISQTLLTPAQRFYADPGYRRRSKSFTKGMLLLLLLALCTTSASSQGTRKQLFYDFTLPGYTVSTVGKDLDKIRDANNVMNDGGYILTGYNDYYDTDLGTSSERAIITKLDKCGSLIWSRDLIHNTIGYNSRGASVRQASDDGYITTGAVELPSGAWEILLVKTDQFGGLQWYKRYGGGLGDNFGTTVQEVFNPTSGQFDGYILTGAINNYFDNQYCNGIYENASLIVIRTDVNGTILWQQAIKPMPLFCTPPLLFPDYHHYAYGYDIQQVKDGAGAWTDRFIVAGVYKTPMVYDNGATGSCTPCQKPINEYPLLVNLTDNVTSGAINWAKVYPSPVRSGVTGQTLLHSVLQTEDGFVAAGSSVFSGTDNDIYLLETDANGGLLTARNYDAGTIERGASIEVTPTDYYIFGSIQTLSPIFGLTSDGLITKIDRSTGNATWTHRFGRTGYDILERSIPETGGRFSSIGHTESFTPTADYYFVNNVADDAFIDCEGCSVEEELTMHEIEQPVPLVEYDHDFATEKEEDAYWSVYNPTKDVECECVSCPGVDITFQHGYGVWEDRGHSLRETSDLGFILAGFTAGDDMNNPDVLLYKTDNAGAMQWRTTIFEGTVGGNVYEERGFSVRQTTNDAYVIAGDLASPVTPTDHAAYLVKTNSGGTPLWSLLLGHETSGGTYDDAARSVRQSDENGNGTFEVDEGFVIGGFTNRPSAPGANLYNAYIARIDVNSSGVNPFQVWGLTYGHDLEDFFHEVIPTDDDGDGVADDGYIAVGYSNSTFDNTSPYTYPTGLNGYNVFVTKVAQNGAVQWSKIYGTDDDEVAYSIVQTDDDNDGEDDDGFVIVGAQGLNINLDANGEVDNSVTTTDFYVLKIADDGTLQWANAYSQGNMNNDQVAYSVIQSSDFSYVITGEALIPDQTHGPHVQEVLFKLSGCGELLWVRQYPVDPSAADEDHARELTQTSDGGYALFGSTCTYAGGGGSAAKGDFHLIKTDCLGVVCLSDSFPLSDINPLAVEYAVNPIVGDGPGDEEGTPDELEVGIEYEICPEEEERAAPVPGGVDLSWLLTR